MTLKELYIKGFKCFKDSGRIPIHSLTVFIGENDAGKSSTLDALDILLNNTNAKHENYHYDVISEKYFEELEISGTFEISEDEQEAQQISIENKIFLTKKISHSQGMQYFVRKKVFEDERLNSFRLMKVGELRELMAEFELNIKGLKPELQERMQSFVEKNLSPEKLSELEIPWKKISNILPIYQRFASSDYGNPQNLIAKVLGNVYRTHFYENDEETGGEKLKTDYSVLKSEIETNLDTKITNSLKEIIQKYNPKVQDVSGSYTIDFSKGLNFHQLKIDTGSGLKPIENRGEGAKKRLYLSILEWDKQIENEYPTTRGIIKAYDEPDSNLHFGAQRKLFYTIQNESNRINHVQNIVCTHALTMIDRAPALSINCLTPNEHEQSEVSYLETDEDDTEVREFLSEVSEVGGLRNSSIFYEKCFVLVEGESEVNALPILYKKYCKRNLAEDGVVIVNLQSNGAWQNFLRLLKKNKENCTLLFLDNDTQFEGSKAKVTSEKLITIGFSETFFDNNVFFVGEKEFEDTYNLDSLVAMLNKEYQKHNGEEWNVDEIRTVKENATKFSKELEKFLGGTTQSWITKPELALNFAKNISQEDLLQMTDTIALFDRISTVIN